MSERACAVRHSHILSRKFPPFLGFLSVADRTTNETKCSLYECALREIPRLPVCRSRGTAVARKRQNDLLSGCQNCALTWRAARRKKLPTLRQCSGDTNPQKSGQDVGMSDRARSLRHSPPGQGFAPTPRQRLTAREKIPRPAHRSRTRQTENRGVPRLRRGFRFCD